MNNLEIVKKIVEEFFEKACFEIEAEVSLSEEKTILINITTDQPQILIGEKGQTLSEIQHLVKIILRKKLFEDFYLNIDINDYKQKKQSYLKETANSMADDVALTKKEKVLTPMNAYERRIVHMELAERQDVITESIGDKEERRIIIKPKS